jgi:hypothetical protein
MGPLAGQSEGILKSKEKKPDVSDSKGQNTSGSFLTFFHKRHPFINCERLDTIVR